MVAIDVELVGSRVVMVGLNEGIHGLNDAIFASGAGGEHVPCFLFEESQGRVARKQPVFAL